MQSLPKKVSTLKIPRSFISHSKISSVLLLTINEFNYEEQSVIYLYYLVKLPISEIATFTELTVMHVISTLVLYSEKLAARLSIFKKVLSYDENDMVSIKEMFELEGALEK